MSDRSFEIEMRIGGVIETVEIGYDLESLDDPESPNEVIPSLKYVRDQSGRVVTEELTDDERLEVRKEIWLDFADYAACVIGDPDPVR